MEGIAFSITIYEIHVYNRNNFKIKGDIHLGEGLSICFKITRGFPIIP